MMMTTDDQHPWSISAEQRQQVVAAVMEVINGSTDPREQLAAVRIVLNMEQLNMQWEQKRESELRQAINRLAAERGILLT